MRFLALLAAVCVLSAGAAHAQSRDVNAAAARALIDRAQAADLFEVVEGDSVATRHLASGMVCHFYPGATRVELLIFSNLPRGEDVGCVQDRADQATTLYATRYAPPMSARDALADAEAAIRQRFPNAQPSPPSIVMSSEGLPATLVANYLITVRGERWLTSAIVARVGDWIIKLRYSGPARDAEGLMQAELEANAMITAALLEMAPARSSPKN